ncbi:DUF4177 domain-containing protein [Vannielia litorea]|uniref:DUF4177 domain-containing protein n=1 Tax=Vannielia litorea TaxID=1217970 RepID=UPI001C972994|nr:DUF4177 domain-containing protein [Vannielia litorea]MBY6046845.1 DUF4177 domain-containing protein [Vannielia litorea]MBY6074259.1 DUF4177 domain-containing protein [Vannielia litorea]MBY6153240.1 DUF4177 domain-containing protein [Vannielia litorea]
MPRYEYRVVPAPEKGKKAKGAKGTSGRFAVALQDLMNEMGAAGWEYQRTDTLPCQERVGLTGRQTTFQHMLVFRRTLAAEAVSDEEVTALLAAPEDEPEADAVEEPETAEEQPEPQPEKRDAVAAARDVAAALSARAREGKAPALGPATQGDKPGSKADVAAE